MEEDQMCWICLCGADGLDTGEDDQCVRVCACPRVCHKRCLGRWQLQNAGKKEEKYCRFCQQRYPDWRNSLTPGEITPSTPVMAVSVRGKVYKLRVRSGPEGKEDFKRQIRQLLGFTQDMDFDVIFECKTPHNGSEKVQLHGFEAFEAASWCAAVSAAKRKKAKQEAAARAAAAAAAAGGGLSPMASCPAALTMPDSSNSRPSSSGGAAAGSSGSSSDGGSESMSPDAVPGLAAQHDVESTIAPSAFATATATAAVTGAASGCPGSAHHGSSLLGSTISEPHPATASGLGMFGLQPGGASAAHYHPLLSPAGSSLPHAIVEEQARPLAAGSGSNGSTGSNGSIPMDGVEQGGLGVNAARPSSTRSTRRSSSCPGEGVYGDQRPGSSTRSSSHQHGRASYSSGGALQNAMSVPVGSSSGGSVGGRSSRDGSEREEGEGSGRSKVGRWLRRVLHLEGPWRGAMPAGVFMGVV